MAQCPPPTDESIRIFILKIQDPLPTFIGSDVQLRPHTPGSMWKSSVSVPMTSLSYVQPLSDVEPDVEQIQFDQKHFIQMLKDQGYSFDIAFTSVLKRAVKTLYHVQDATDLHWIPVVRHWRLNERMYGALQGLNKSETAAKHGEEQVKIWRRSYDTPPPPVDESNEHWPGHDPKYQYVDKNLIPKSECLKDTVARVLPFWYDQIVPEIKKGQRVIISAHGNSLRAMVKYLDNMSDADIMALNIPTGIPLVYELDGDLKPIKHYYLADEAQVKAAMDKVANQGKAK